MDNCLYVEFDKKAGAQGAEFTIWHMQRHVEGLRGIVTHDNGEPARVVLEVPSDAEIIAEKLRQVPGVANVRDSLSIK